MGRAHLSDDQIVTLLNLSIVSTKYSKLAMEIVSRACRDDTNCERDQIIVEFIKQMYQQKNYSMISLLIR